MSSFNDAIAQLITVLQNDSALAGFCSSRWGRSLTVKKVFKQRTEVSMNELPLCLITRPSVAYSFLSNTVRDGDHSVRLYLGFLQNDRRKALEEFVEFEEKVEDAFYANYTLNGTAINTTPESSINDEGKFHPVYFIVKEIKIRHRRI